MTRVRLHSRTNVRFFLDPVSGILMNCPSARELDLPELSRMFAKIIEAAERRCPMKVQLYSINREGSIDEAFATLDPVRTVWVRAHPAVTSNASAYADLNEGLARMRASEVEFKLDAGEAGLDPDALKKDLATQGMRLAADGLGDWRMEGEIQGRAATIASDDLPLKQGIPASQDPMTELVSLIPAFSNVLERLGI
jgi:hypothetical protein